MDEWRGRLLDDRGFNPNKMKRVVNEITLQLEVLTAAVRALESQLEQVKKQETPRATARSKS